jgi:flavin-dependent dehydrogenase
MSALPGKTSYSIIEFLIKKSPFAKWFKKAKVVEESGAIVEMFTPIKTPYQGNILLVGEAACFAEVLYQGATMCGYMAARAMDNELKGKDGFKAYADWWQSSFEWNENPKRMADYVKRVLFTRFFSPDELDMLFDLSKKYPAISDEMDAGVYDYTNVLMDYFMEFPEIPSQLKDKMKNIKEADMGKLATVIGQRRD